MIMALNYSVSLRPNPLDKDAAPKAYATAQIIGFLRRSAGENQQRCEHQSQQTACEIACVHRSQSIPSD